MQPYTILIPHYKTGKMTAYCLSQILKHSQGRALQVVIVNNSPGDDSLKYVYQLAQDISAASEIYTTFLDYPKGIMQSHGIAFDYALQGGFVNCEYFITLESDSFPVEDNWLEWYDEVVAQGGSCTGSVLKLSGGTYLHPAGAMYKKSDWKEALQYSDFINQFYYYLPNTGMKEGFPCHLMIRKSAFLEFCSNPDKFNVELHDSYVPLIDIKTHSLKYEFLFQKAREYEPVTKVFHNGMGSTQESFNTYRFRDMFTYCKDTILSTKEDIIYRMGYEPGQWFSYWLMANKKAIFEIPTKTVWLPGREGQQQEYTLTANGVKHLWGMTAYNGASGDNLKDIIDYKNSLLDELYNSLPTEQRIAE